MTRLKRSCSKLRSSKAGRNGDIDGLPLHLLDFSPEQLKWVLPRILVGSNLALCRAESVTAKILSKRKPETKS